jgi:glycosyltransferase involved in cell wall biosynthesis
MNARILYTTADASPQSGAFRSFIAMSRGIRERGFEPIMVLHQDAEATPLLTREERRNAHFLPLPRLSRHQPPIHYVSRTIQSVRQTAHIAHENEVSLIHTNEILDVYGGLAAKMARLPCVWHVRAHLEQPLLAWLLPRIVHEFAARIITASTSVTEYMFTKQGISTQKIETIHNPAPDPRRFHPGVDGQVFRQELGITDDTPIVGMIGKLTARKGHAVLIRAAPLILERFPNTLFVIVGGKVTGKHHGVYVEHLERLVEDLALQEKVVFTGFRTDIPQIVAACDVIAHCSTYPDPFPGVVLQGMAMGKPVIATDLGGAREQVGEAGVLVPPADPGVLAEAILDLLGNAEKRRSLGRLAAEWVSRFSTESFYGSLTLAYRDVITADRGEA